MRISTRTYQMQFLATLAEQQARLARTQQQAATGRKVNTAGDNPAAAVQIVNLGNALEQLESFDRSAGIARGRLSLEESALTSVTSALQRLRDLVIDARGPGRTDAERRLIAAEAQELLDGLMDAANTQDGEGRYLFAGNRVHTRPFEMTASGVAFAGDQGVRTQRVSESRVVQEGDSGAEVFERIRNGNGTFSVDPAAGNTGSMFYAMTSVTDAAAWDQQTYAVTFVAPDAYEVRDSSGALVASGSYQSNQTIQFSGIAISFEGDAAPGDSFTVSPSRYQSVFASVQDLITALNSTVISQDQLARFQSDTNSALLDIDRALERVSDVRGRVGQRLAVLDEQQASNDRFALDVQTILSRAQDTDLAAIISELEAQAFALETSQRVYARLQGQSLFELI